MDSLKQIASVSGQPGLFRILKPGRNGVIVETLDAKKDKSLMGGSARVSVLSEISMYVDRPDSDGSVPLSEILKLLADKYGDDLPVNAKSDGAEQSEVLESVLPDYDRDRVRSGDIKKLISWYLILRQHAPEVFTEEDSETATSEEAAEAPADEQPTA